MRHHEWVVALSPQSSVLLTRNSFARLPRLAVHRQRSLIALKIALPAQEVVIAATRTIGINAAHIRPRFVHRAAARLRIEKNANAAVVFVFLMSKDRKFVAFFGVAVQKCLAIDVEMLRQPADVQLFDLDLVIAAAVSGTFCAVVWGTHARRHAYCAP